MPYVPNAPQQNIPGPLPGQTAPAETLTPPKLNLSTHPALNLRSMPLVPPFIPSQLTAPSLWDSSTPIELDVQGAHHIMAKEKEHRQLANLCYYCGKPGHTSQNCPSALMMWRTTAIEIHMDSTSERGKDDVEE